MRKTKRSKTKRSKTKRLNRKHNYLGKARIKYYSIKKGGEGLYSNRSKTPRKSSRTPRKSSRTPIPRNSSITPRKSSITPRKSSRTPRKSSRTPIPRNSSITPIPRNSSRTLKQLSSPVVRDIYAEPKYYIYDPHAPIVVANKKKVMNKVAEVREMARKAQAMTGHPKVHQARHEAQSKVL